MKSVTIFIDGSCSGNRGPTGWAAVCPLNGKVLKKTGFNSNINGTNNQSELHGAITGVKAVKVRSCKITLFTDSNYLITAWNNIVNEQDQRIKANKELWMEFIKLVKDGKHTIEFVKVKAHSGVKYNELADKLAKAECRKAKHQLLR